MHPLVSLFARLIGGEVRLVAHRRPSFEEFSRRYPVCQQDSKFRLALGFEYEAPTLFALDRYDDIRRAQRVAWEEYDEFVRIVRRVKGARGRERLG